MIDVAGRDGVVGRNRSVLVGHAHKGVHLVPDVGALPVLEDLHEVLQFGLRRLAVPPVRALPGHHARRALQHAHGERVVREPARVFEGLEVQIQTLEHIPGEALAAAPDRDLLGVENFLNDPHAPLVPPLAQVTQRSPLLARPNGAVSSAFGSERPRAAFGDEVHGQIAVVGCLAQPDKDTGRGPVNGFHQADLVVALACVLLFDVEGIDPEQCGLRYQLALEVEKPPEVFSDVDGATADLNQSCLGQLTPRVRQSCVGRTAMCVFVCEVPSDAAAALG